ncbi:MAG: cytochrome P450 [Spirochaetaceae bacterium]|nr:cytochrome P450 [Myxococcales bacterium]MCB9725992.1 cytochrome P450 [Spirochaetaceae bacterium]
MAAPALDGSTLIDPASYARIGYPHTDWSTLRRSAPIERFQPEGWPPFWAITRHADIVSISKRPDAFLNVDGINFDRNPEARGQAPVQMRTIIEMDPPDHRKYRAVASKFFTPRSLGAWDPIVEEMARKLVDGLGREGECDFVTEIASMHPLKIICRILGAPEEDEAFVLRLTNEIFGREDEEFRRPGTATPEESVMQAAMEFYQYFQKILADRRERPREDLVSLFANARVDGEPMNEIATMGYCLVMFIAGHETTRGAISGGMKALLDHPAELAKWQADPSLGKTAIEEILRYVTPVNTMARTVARDVTIGGRQLSEGDRLVMFYASANRDEAVFDDPDAFRVDRNPNPHLAFGIGEHFCLGAHLARKTSGAIFGELVPRLELVEAAAPAERVPSNLVPGLKHLPIRYRLRPGR